MTAITPVKGTMQEAAEYYGVTITTIRRWISEGRLYAERVGPKLIRVEIGSMQTTPLQYVAGHGE